MIVSKKREVKITFCFVLEMWTGVSVRDGLREDCDATVNTLWDLSRRHVVWHGYRYVSRLLLHDVALVNTHSGRVPVPGLMASTSTRSKYRRVKRMLSIASKW